MDAVPRLILAPVPRVAPEQTRCSPDDSREETTASKLLLSPAHIKTDPLELSSCGSTTASNPRGFRPTKQFLMRSSFRPVGCPIFQTQIQLNGDKALKQQIKQLPSPKLERKPLFRESKREQLMIVTTPEQQLAYLSALKGTPTQTKSLHKYIKIITKRILQKRRKQAACTPEELKHYDEYDEGSCTFLTMQKLFGIESCGANSYYENPSHDAIRRFVLQFYSSPEMAASSATGIMNFEQKLAMLKYLQRFEVMVLEPLRLGWK